MSSPAFDLLIGTKAVAPWFNLDAFHLLTVPLPALMKEADNDSIVDISMRKYFSSLSTHLSFPPSLTMSSTTCKWNCDVLMLLDTLNSSPLRVYPPFSRICHDDFNNFQRRDPCGSGCMDRLTRPSKVRLPAFRCQYDRKSELMERKMKFLT